MKKVIGFVVAVLIAVPIVLYGAKITMGKGKTGLIPATAGKNQAPTNKAPKPGAPCTIKVQGEPLEINYQGWLADKTDTMNLGVTGKVNMMFTLYDALTGGSNLWTESQDSVQVNKGIFNVLLGKVNPLPDSIFTGSTLYLETQVSGEVLSPRKDIVNVAYAIRSLKSHYARYADTATYAIGIADSTFDSRYVLKTGDNMTGPLTISGDSSASLLYASQGGTGTVGYFGINNASNSNDAVSGSTNGMGRAGYFQATNNSNSNPALEGYTTGSGDGVRGFTSGTGNAGYFEVSNSSNMSNAVEAITNGNGNAVLCEATGTSGNAGHFYISNPSNSQDLVTLYHNGTGNFINTNVSGCYLDRSGNWHTPSSRALKENIRELSTEEAIETVKKLDPVKFNYKRNKEEKHVGFIAEDVPELVATKDRKSLTSMDIVAVLTKVVQEQQKTAQEQQKKIDLLEKKVEQLEKK